MADAEKPSVAKALLEARPPATDRFTYLTLIEETLSADSLPTLHEVLQDAKLTQDIGWDLVEMLVPLLPASENCLDDVARLGNPREVILKVLEVLEGLKAGRRPGGEEEEGDEDDEDDGDLGEEDAGKGKDDNPQTDESDTRTFIVLLGMLSILQRRIKTKYPSRFLETILRTILAAYRPEQPAMTTAVLGLVRSLSATKRPLPPMRRSESQLGTLSMTSATGASGTTGALAQNPETTQGPHEPAAGAAATKITPGSQDSAIGQVASNSYQADDPAAVSVPDPEAEEGLGDPVEGAIQQRLLQSFVTCVLEAYVSANEMAWAPRLFESYHPKKIVPGRQTALQRYREDPELVARDSAVGKLAALALDLGLTYSDAFVSSVSNGPVRRNPLATLDVAAVGTGPDGPNSIPLSTGGSVCLLAYWVFSAAVFQADAPVPNMFIFPDHHAMLETFLGDGAAAAEVARTPGTIEALVTLGMWLDHNGHYTSPSAATSSASSASSASVASPVAPYMPYHHLLTLCSVFHPSLPVRNAATLLAGAVLHADPDPEDRLRILQDLLENCMFATLKACAITWLREELLLADKAEKDKVKSPFSTTEAVEQLQYIIFPDLQSQKQEAEAVFSSPSASSDSMAGLMDYWVQNSPFLLQVANFVYFLFSSERLQKTVVPSGMGPAIEQRYVEPLLQGVTRLRAVLESETDVDNADGANDGEKHGHGELVHSALDLEVLASLLRSLKLS